MFGSTSVRALSSQKPSCDGLIGKEVVALQERQQEINRRLADIHSRSNRIDKMQQQIINNKQAISNIEVELNKINFSLEEQNQQLTVLERDRMELVIQLEDSEEKVERIGQELVGSFQNHPTDIERIRMALIDIQTSDQLKKVEQQFKIRPNIIIFLKERSMSHQNKIYQHGVELQISLLGLSEEFKQFILRQFDQQHLYHLKQKLNTPLVNYCRMLKAAQMLLIQMPSECNEEKEIDESIIREQIMNSLFAERSHKRDLQQEINKLREIIESIHTNISKFQRVLIEKTRDKEQAQQMVQYLQKKIAKTIKLSAETKRLTLQLGEVTQAIHYLTAKRTENENFNSFNIIPNQENQQIHQIISVWSPEKPDISDSLFKSKASNLKNTSKTSLLKSPTRDMNRSTKLKTRMTSPQPSWK